MKRVKFNPKDMVMRVGGKEFRMDNSPFQDLPCAAYGLISYRYRGRFGWIMIGAKDDKDALKEAMRSTGEMVSMDRLQKWNGSEYITIWDKAER